jgi:hypothetical protein
MPRTVPADEGLIELGALKSLTTLYLVRTQVNDTGMKELRLVLPKCAIVK